MLRFADRNEHQKPTKHSEGAAAFDNMRGPGEHEELWGSRCRAFGFNNGVICRLSASTVLTHPPPEVCASASRRQIIASELPARQPTTPHALGTAG